MDYSRMTGPEEQKGQKNASIFRLLNLSKQRFLEKKIESKQLEESIEKKRKFFNRLRNKRLGHNDLDHMLQPDGKETPITKDENDMIPKALDELSDLFVIFIKLYDLEIFPKFQFVKGESNDLILALRNKS